jgi:RNA polymerase sigma-70 factor (ECF subfamily)
MSSPHGDALLALYDDALPEVYGYLLARCRQRTVAEELTSEVFMAAVDSVRRAAVTEVTVAWLIGIARHKLLDHWRREERETRRLTAVAGQTHESDDPWDVKLDVLVARDVLAVLSPSQRGALTLRYLDDLPVARVAEILGRTLHATEALLVRARHAFRSAYEAEDGR